MTERNDNVSQFEGVNALAKRIEELTKERDDLTRQREEAQTKLLTDHSIALADLKLSLARLIEQTADFPNLASRVSKLETWKAFVAGIAAAFTMIGGSIGFVIGLLDKR
jgi:hypothetical protein